jgi:hypothetical protein
MSLERLPANIEQGVQRLADELHISHDEAVLKLIETGLTTIRPSAEVEPNKENAKKPGELLFGLMSSPEDAAIAACALRRALPIATGNTRHYQYVVDAGFSLDLQNWREL